MTETPSSIITKKDCTPQPSNTPIVGKVNTAPPIKDMRRCPAIMLAVNRKVKAKGRIKFLNNSTIAINLINPSGVPLGTRCDKKSSIDLPHENIITASQEDRAMGKVHSKWEVKENRYGKRAKKFNNLIVKKRVPINTITPLLVLGKTYFTSFLKVLQKPVRKVLIIEEFQ